MRQRRWKRRRSDIFTDFTQPLQKPFSLSRAWKAVSWKLREPVGSYEWEPGCYLIAKIPGNIPVSGWNLRLTRDRWQFFQDLNFCHLFFPSISFKNSLRKRKCEKDRVKSVFLISNIFFFLKRHCTQVRIFFWEKILQSGMRGEERKEKEKVDDTGINTRSIIDDLVGRRDRRAEWRPGISFTISAAVISKGHLWTVLFEPASWARGNNRGRNGSSNFVPTEREHHLVDRKTPRGQSHLLSDRKYARIDTSCVDKNSIQIFFCIHANKNFIYNTIRIIFVSIP